MTEICHSERGEESEPFIMKLSDMLFLDAKHSSITYTYNRTSRAVELNGAVEQIIGKEFVGLASVNLMTLIERLHPDDQDFIKALKKKQRIGDDLRSSFSFLRNLICE